MNPRAFCREAAYPQAVLLTYSFDPIFFERIVQRDLLRGGTTELMVVGDRTQLQMAIERCAGQLTGVGRSYLLLPADTDDTFHPKLILRVGPMGAKVLIGSGNLTFFGWGGNQELGAELVFRADQPEASEIVNSILDFITPHVSGEDGLAALARLRGFPWLGTRNPGQDVPLLYARADQTLFAQIARRWSGRKFERLKIFTGSTDENGAFIEACQRQFNIKECIVAVSPGEASFLKTQIAALPLSVRLAPFPGPRRLHGKFYWFEGPDGPAALMGSPNCSRVAWLMAPDDGGNVESLLVYDAPTEEAFAGILAMFPEERLSVERPGESIPKPSKPPSPPCYIRSVSFRRSDGYLEAMLHEEVAATAQVTLVGPDGVRVELRSTSGTLWAGFLPETHKWPEETMLVHLEIQLDEATFKTPRHWLDDREALMKSGRLTGLSIAFRNLERANRPSEYEQVLADLAQIRFSLFSEQALHGDPRPQAARLGRSREDTEPAAPVTPEDLTRSLEDLDFPMVAVSHSSRSGLPHSLGGIMGILFPDLEEPEAPPEEPGLNAEAMNFPKEGAEDGPRTGPTHTMGRNPGARRKAPPESYRRRLREHVDGVFTELTQARFASQCTATRMVSALAYPLAIALRGWKQEWLQPADARSIVTRVVAVVLDQPLKNATDLGLLRKVALRYAEQGQEGSFREVAGDGTLWVALLATLTAIPWESQRERLEFAINLARVFRCDLLRGELTAGRFQALVSRIQVERARVLIGHTAPLATNAIEAIEAALHERFQQLIRTDDTHEPGDFIWNPGAGWGIVRSSPKAMKMTAFLYLRGAERTVQARGNFVNLKTALKNSPEVDALLRRLMDLGA